MKPSSKQSSLRRRQKKHHSQVAYDSLEARLPLTTFVVNTADDTGNLSDGLISLREAAIAANTNAAYGDAPAGSASGDLIQLHPDIVQIDLALGAIELTDDVFVWSDNPDQVVVTSDETSGLFEVNTSEHVGFRNLYLYNGAAAGGGGVVIRGGGVTNFNDITFRSNKANSGRGGAINHYGGRLNVVDSVFAHNRTQADGGAIVSFSGVLNIHSTTFDANFADTNGAAIKLVNGRLNGNNLTFTDNWNRTNGDGNGGAINLWGTSVASIQNSSFEGNWSAHGGGGVWISETSYLSVQNSSFEGNHARLDDGPEEFGGGAIFNDGGNLIARNTTFSQNSSGAVSGDGGAIYANGGFNRIDSGAFNQNSASGDGGAIYVNNGRLETRNLTLSGNLAGLEPRSIAEVGHGGAIYITGNAASALVSGSTIENSQAANSGGAIWMGAGARLGVSDSILRGNQADGTEVNAGGGAVFNDGGNLSLIRSTVEGNEATAGGGIYLKAGGLVGSSANINDNLGSQFGGGIAGTGGFINLYKTTLGGNSTSPTGKGGGLYLQGNVSSAVFFQSSITGNTASNGAGAYVENGIRLTLMDNSHVSFNVATGSGGGIYTDGHLHSRETTFDGNSAGESGGGLFISESGSAQIALGTFQNNTAVEFGGGIFNGGELGHNLVTFLDNSAGLEGDSIFEFSPD